MSLNLVVLPSVLILCSYLIILYSYLILIKGKQIRMLSFNLTEIISSIQKGEYEQAAHEITGLLEGQSCPFILSTLYTNRGAMNWSAGKLLEAVDDFEQCVRYNHLNYLGYFNLFSILALMGKYQPALENLCCALSCLYLIRGKAKNNEGDINKAIKHAENNLEARLIKSLFYIKKKKYGMALNQIKWALEVDPNNYKLLIIKQQIENLSQSGSRRPPLINFSSENNTSQRLRCTLYEQDFEGLDFEVEIASKLVSFNEINNELNGQRMSKVDDVVPVYLLHDVRNVKSQMQAEQPKAQTSSLLCDEDDQPDNKMLLDIPDSFNGAMESVNKSSEVINDDHIHVGKDELSFDNVVASTEQSNNKNKLRLEDQAEEVESVEVSDFNENTQSESMRNSSQFLNSSRHSAPDSSTYTLLASSEEGRSLSIKVHSIQVTGLLPQQVAKLSNLYCVFERVSSKDGRDGDEGLSESQQLENRQQILKVRVYNKQITAFKDRLLGFGRQEIAVSDQIQIPFYQDEAELNAQQIGRVLLEVKYK